MASIRDDVIILEEARPPTATYKSGMQRLLNSNSRARVGRNQAKSSTIRSNSEAGFVGSPLKFGADGSPAILDSFWDNRHHVSTSQFNKANHQFFKVSRRDFRNTSISPSGRRSTLWARRASSSTPTRSTRSKARACPTTPS